MKKILASAAAATVLMVGGCGTVLLVGGAGLQAAAGAGCTAGEPLQVAVGALPANVGKWKAGQLHNAAAIMGAGASLGLDAQGQTIGVMTAMGESSLMVLDRGDAVGPDSRGLFQQRANGAWGSLADRMNPTVSATNFFKALMAVPDWRQLAPTQAAHRVQRNADPYYYARFWSDAVTVVATLSGDPDLAAQLAQNNGGQPCGVQDSSGVEGTSVTGGWARPSAGAITSGFGPRTAPTAGASTLHKGVDFGGGCDAPIYAAANGIVVASGPAHGFGNWIVLDDGGGVRTVYGHMKTQDLLVAVGEKVHAGQLISRIGREGTATGCHLHFEVHQGDAAVDPVAYLRPRCHCLD